MEPSCIEIRGAREHNLQGIDLDVPKNRLVVFTGVSGSGKSSLAFDTIFAEGQRRYVESLSPYARQFLGQMDKPRYDAIRGLTPTIAVSQGAAGRNPRSTVGTMTEVHDHLRVLFARAGTQRCHRCGAVVQRWSAAEITARLPADRRFMLLATVSGPLSQLAAAGFTRVRVNGEVIRIEDMREDSDRFDVVVDRPPPGADRGRLADSIETALRAGGGRLMLALDGEPDRVFGDRLACHDCGIDFPPLTPQSFSFNSPQGMCRACKGLGMRDEMDPALVVPDGSLTLHQGAILPWKGPLTRREGWTYQILARLSEHAGFDLDTPWDRLSPTARRLLLYGTDGEKLDVRYEGERGKGVFHMAWEGVIPTMVRRMRETKSEQQRRFYLGFFADRPCSECQGTRLRPESRAVEVGGLRIEELSRSAVDEARARIGALELTGARAAIAADLLVEIGARLRFLADVGLGYLSLERGAGTLSGGESQRIRLASQLGGELTGVTYVLDEPSIGLHARDTRRLVGTMARLRDAGNTVIVVEHERDTVESADHVVDFGPGAGASGGRVVFAGSPAALREDGGLTGQYLSGRLRVPVPDTRRAPDGRWLVVRNARQNNLRGIDVAIPIGRFVAVTGVSGAGKSSLVDEILSPALHNRLHRAERPVGTCDGIDGIEHLAKVIDVDQGPIGRSPRSNPATYTGAWDPIRAVFAATREGRMRGFSASRFSFNARGGRCEACKGDGSLRVEMHFLADVFVPCEVCGGKRFDEATLSVRVHGLDVAQVLELTVDEALDVFRAHPAVRRVLETLSQVGLGYLRLGQPANTLSGGEAQRVKLSRELARASEGGTMYLLDEPTTGLHFDDVRKLVGILQRLVDGGNTVVVVEHDLDVVRCADWIVDLGPEGGAAGGRVVAAGPPEAVAATEASITGRVLRERGLVPSGGAP